MADEALNEIANRIEEGLKKVLKSGFPYNQSDLNVVVRRTEEYLRDRMSVSPEWRQLLDDLEQYRKLAPDIRRFLVTRLQRQDFIDGQGFQPKKNDEAFRFFLDEPDIRN